MPRVDCSILHGVNSYLKKILLDGGARGRSSLSLSVDCWKDLPHVPNSKMWLKLAFQLMLNINVLGLKIFKKLCLDCF